MALPLGPARPDAGRHWKASVRHGPRLQVSRRSPSMTQKRSPVSLFPMARDVAPSTENAWVDSPASANGVVGASAHPNVTGSQELRRHYSSKPDSSKLRLLSRLITSPNSLALGPEHLLAVNLVSAIAFWPSSEISQSINCWPNSFLTCGCLAGFTSMTRRSPDRIHPALRHDVRSDTSRAQSMAHSSAGRRWCRRPDREHYQDKRSRDPIESRSCVHAATSQAASGECRAFCGPDGTPRNAKGHPAPVLVPPIATAPSVPHPSHSFLESVKL